MARDSPTTGRLSISVCGGRGKPPGIGRSAATAHLRNACRSPGRRRRQDLRRSRAPGAAAAAAAPAAPRPPTYEAARAEGPRQAVERRGALRRRGRPTAKAAAPLFRRAASAALDVAPQPAPRRPHLRASTRSPSRQTRNIKRAAAPSGEAAATTTSKGERSSAAGLHRRGVDKARATT